MRTSLFLASALCAPLIHASKACVPRSDAKEHPSTPKYTTHKTDVIIVGGGAGGTYAGLQLKAMGKSVTVVEVTNKLGGHVNTFIPPNGLRPIDYGVGAYLSNNETLKFFSDLNVPLMNVSASPFPTKYVDFKTGQLVPNMTAVNPMDYIGPLTNYLLATLNFPGLAEGFYDLGKKVPDDLLLPFGDFVKKYKLEDVLQLVWIFAQSVGKLMDTPTLYVLQNFGTVHVLGLQAGYIAPATKGGYQEVYDKAAAILGESVLFSSKVLTTTRSDEGVTAVVRTPTGNKVIKAKALIVCIPPTIHNLQGFDLSAEETRLFSMWKARTSYFVGVSQKTNLPDLTTFDNVDVTKPAGLPVSPFVSRIETTGDAGYQTLKVIGEPDSAKAQQLVIDAVAHIGKNYGITGNTTEFAAWEEHTDLGLQFTPSQIAAGAYADLYALQGLRSTFIGHSAFCSDYTSVVFDHMKKRILPGVLKILG